MSTIVDSHIQNEEKQFDRRSDKDDQKQQSALRKKDSSADVPVDASGSSLVGGTIQAVTAGVDKAIHLLPESLQTRATDLQSAITQQGASLAEAAQPVTDAYQQDGLLAAAKVAGGLGSTAVSGLKTQAMGAGTNLKQSVKAKLPTALGGGAPGAIGLDDAAPKKNKGRRRRGGRGHGHRGMKTRAIPIKEGESIRDTLGEKAAEINEVVIEDVQATAPGLIGSIKSTASGLVGSVQSTASGIVGSVQSTASGIVGSVKGAAASGAAAASGIVAAGQQKISTLTGNTKEVVEETLESNNLKSKQGGSKPPIAGGKQKPLKAKAKEAVALAKDKLDEGILAAKDAGASAKASLDSGIEQVKEKASLQRKPTLERRDELPSLGTPATPGDKDLKFATKETPMAVNAAASSSGSGIIGTAKFYGAQLVDAIKDKVDNLSMNADDDSTPVDDEATKASALDGAKKQLKTMKDSLSGEKDEDSTVDKQ